MSTCEVSEAQPVPAREISISGDDFRGIGLSTADVDDDGSPEVITASESVQILEWSDDARALEVVASIPFIGAPHLQFSLADVVRVGDGDGRSEIIVVGNSGRVSVYRHSIRDSGTQHHYPVVWQSPVLLDDGVEDPAPDQPAHSLTQGLDLADLDADGDLEILVGTMELGTHPAIEPSRLGRVIGFDDTPDGSFEPFGESGWISRSGIPGIRLGQLFSSADVEAVFNGTWVLTVPSSGEFTVLQVLPERAHVGLIAGWGALRSPTTGMRIVPTSSSLPARIETEGLLEFSIEIASELGDLGPLRVSITSGSPEIKIESETVAFQSFVHEDVAFAVNIERPPRPADVTLDGTELFFVPLRVLLEGSGFRQEWILTLTLAF